MLVLKAIDRYNYDDILELAVRDDQKEFVASNAYSLAQAYVMPECTPLAVYSGMSPVGFVMYALDEDDREYWIYRVMISAPLQGKGYGREAMRLLIERIKKEAPERRVIYISFEPENTVAKALYTSLGFVPDGRVIDDEVVYRLTV